MTTTTLLPSELHWQLQLGALGQVVRRADDVLQALRIIAVTPLGSVPLLPEFGCDAWRWIDKPITVARPHLVRELMAAWTKWEPRVSITAVRPVPTDAGLHIEIAGTLQNGAPLVGSIVWGG